MISMVRSHKEKKKREDYVKHIPRLQVKILVLFSDVKTQPKFVTEVRGCVYLCIYFLRVIQLSASNMYSDAHKQLFFLRSANSVYILYFGHTF